MMQPRCRYTPRYGGALIAGSPSGRAVGVGENATIGACQAAAKARSRGCRNPKGRAPCLGLPELVYFGSRTWGVARQ
jgi:hypothetical protein